jgi:PII-like signaling protein
VSVAVDSRPRIEALLPAVTALKRRGLVTLERARMLSGELPAMRLSEELDEATKLTVYLGRQERAYGAPAYAAVCDLLHRRGVAGATALLGVDGTANGIRRRARFFAANFEVPMMLIAVADGAGISRVLPQLGGLLRDPIVTLERVRICKRDGQLLAEPHALPGTDERGLALWQKLMVYTSEQASHDGRPLHVELVRRLRRHTASGATVLRGVWGFDGDHAPQERLPLSAYRRPFLGTGVCGALTTFSTLQVELLDMDPGPAIAYALVSVVAGFAAVALATNVVRAR